jgi:hypothetical protein
MKRLSTRLQVELLEDRALPSCTSFTGPIAEHCGFDQQTQEWHGHRGQPCHEAPCAATHPACAMSSLSGTVFQNSLGQITTASGVTVTLTETDHCGAKITKTTTTNSNGIYDFSDLQAGTYTVSVSFPSMYPVTSVVGSAGGVSNGTSVSNISLGNDVSATGYQFTVAL